LNKTGDPSHQNIPMAHRPDFSGPVRFIFLEHDPEKPVPVLPKGSSRIKRKCDNDSRTLAQRTKNRAAEWNQFPLAGIIHP
jgi:hypothetical protein